MASKKDARPRLLRALGIVGWDHLEPVILAALATESPLLLVGPHGSAKTMVLTRLAEAMGLSHRHYNASILNFDDLIGFPVPQDGRLIYLQTPATIWDAESVLVDEISRCRPELQNKLFPIVHERIVQGIPLTRLRHRWAAMNPPPAADGRQSGPEYAGAEPLDVALADRFAFIVPVPSLDDLGPVDQLSLLTGLPCGGDAGSRLLALVEDVRAVLPGLSAELLSTAAKYVQAAASKLAAAEHPLSARRAVQLTRNILSTSAALQVLERERPSGSRTSLEDTFYTALRYSLPDLAWGAPVASTTLVTVHRAAWQLAGVADDDEMKAALLERDPVRRIARVLASSLTGAKAGQIIVDTFSSLPRVARVATAAVLGPILAKRTDLPVATVEPIAREFASLAAQNTEQITVRRGGADWRRDILSKELAALNRKTPKGKLLTNAAIVLLQEDHQFEMAALQGAYEHAADVLRDVARGTESAA